MRSDSIAQLAAALAKAQQHMEHAAKDSRNPHFDSRYADLAAIVGACRQPLADQEIAIIQIPSVVDGNLVRMTTVLAHSSGEWIESEALQVQARDAAPQAIGSCLTYLRRYQLAALVGIAPEPDDDDAEAAEGRPRPVKKPPKVLIVEDEPPPLEEPPELAAEHLSDADDRLPEPPKGYVYVERVTSTKTKNPAVTRHLVSFSDHHAFSTIKNLVASVAETARKKHTPVLYTIEVDPKWGEQLKGIHPFIGDDIPF